MSARTKFICLASILIIAIFLRFYHFTTLPPGLYPDEAMNGNNAAEVASTGEFKVYYPENNGREGLLINIDAILLKYFHMPHEPWVLRLPSAIVGVLTVLGLYFLAAELFGTGIGLFSAFLLATSFWHINFSRIGFRAIFAPLLITWALYLFLKALRSAAAAKSDIKAIVLSIIGGIVYALGFYTYIAYRVTPLLFLLFIPFFMRRPKFWKLTLIFAATTFLVAAPIGWYYIQNPGDFFGRTTQIAVTSSANPIGEFLWNTGKTLLMFNFHGDGNWRHNISGAPQLFWEVGIIFLIGIIVALYALWQHWRSPKSAELPLFPLLIIFGWFILALLPSALSNEGIPHALRAILMLPPTMIFAAIGGTWLYNLARGRFSTSRLFSNAVTATAIIFFFTVAMAGYVYYFVIWGQNQNIQGAFSADYVDIGREINKLPASVSKYVVIKGDGVMVHGLPMPAQTTLYITNTYLPGLAARRNIHYLLPNQMDQIPPSTPIGLIFYIR